MAEIEKGQYSYMADQLIDFLTVNKEFITNVSGNTIPNKDGKLVITFTLDECKE